MNLQVIINKRNRFRKAITSLGLFFFATLTCADDKLAPISTAAESQQESRLSYDNSVFELGEVTVTATPTGILDSRDILSSVDVMHDDKIADQNVLTSFDLLHQMPGIQITQFNQGTTTGKFSFRAFRRGQYKRG